jgi:Enoyl-(Acyl carrier protein) reductase
MEMLIQTSRRQLKSDFFFACLKKRSFNRPNINPGRLAASIKCGLGPRPRMKNSAAAANYKTKSRSSPAATEEHKDAKETERMVEEWGRKCLLIDGDIGQEKFCQKAVDQTVSEFRKIDILVNNPAEQHPQDSITKITEKQLEKTFRTNIFAMFFLTKAAMKHLKKGSAIINTTSVTAYKAVRNYSTTHRQRAQSSLSRFRFRRLWPIRAFA